MWPLAPVACLFSGNSHQIFLRSQHSFDISGNPDSTLSRKARTFLLEVLPGNARMPSTVTRSISVRSGGESVQLLGGRQRSVSMKTGGAGLTAQVGRLPFDPLITTSLAPLIIALEPPWPLFTFQYAQRISFWGASRCRN